VDLWWQSAWALIVAIVAADILANFLAIAGAVGTVLWLLSYIYVILFAGVAVRDIFRSSLESAAPYALFMIALYVSITVANVGNLRSFSSETAIEIGCTVHYLNLGGSLGFHQTCLFGYPMRQFLLPVLPSLLLGPSLIHLNMGGGVYFLLGTVIFAGGVARTLPSPYAANVIAALLLSVFLHLYWWNHFFLVFEQSIFPLSFALVLGGLFLYYSNPGQRRRAWPLVGIVLLWLIGSYTPSLAVYGLALAGLVYVAVTQRAERMPALSLIALSAASLWVSLGYRQDLKVAPGSNFASISDLWAGLEHLVYQNHGVPWSSPFLVFPLVLAVALTLIGVFGRLALVVGLWVVAVFVFAIMSHGYAGNVLEFRLHRAIVAVPVLVTLAAALLMGRDIARWQRPLEVLLLLAMAIGIKYYYDYRQSVPPTPALPFIYWFQKHVPNEGSSARPLTVTWMPDSNVELPGTTDTLPYFSPHVQITFLDVHTLGPGCPGLASVKGVIVSQTTAPCFSTLQKEAKSGRIHYVGTYPTTSMHLKVYTT
jgi:hypothetical protein